METFKLSIPIQIPEVIDTKEKDTFDLELGFYGPRGT